MLDLDHRGGVSAVIDGPDHEDRGLEKVQRRAASPSISGAFGVGESQWAAICRSFTDMATARSILDRSLGMAENEGDDGGPGRGAGFDCQTIESLVRGGGRLVEGCGCDLPRGRMLKAELADAVALTSGDRRTEGAAGMWPRAVEIACTEFGIQRRAGLIIGEVIKAARWLPVLVDCESAGRGIAGEVGREPGP